MPPAPARPARLAAALLALAAVGTGLGVLVLWVAPGTVPGARGWLAPWPLAALAVLVTLAATAAARRPGLPAAALAAVGWALAVTVATELPPLASSHQLGDGPHLVPLYLAIGLGTGLWALLGPGPVHERGCALLLVWTAANGKLFTRFHEVAFPLLHAGVLAVLAAAPTRLDLRGLAARGARAVAAIAAGLVVWTTVAALAGEASSAGLSHAARVLLGALLAWALAGSLDARGVARAVDGALAGLALTLVVVAVGLADAAGTFGLDRILETRLRFFDEHPGLVAPFLALGLCLAAARTVAPPRTRLGALERPALALLALATALLLWRNGARASLLGAAVGLTTLAGLLVLARAGRLPRRPLPLGIAALAAAGLVVVGLASPLGAGVRARLDALAHTASPWGQRWHWWRTAARAVAEDPVLGQGPRAEFARARFARPSYLDGDDQATHAHDVFLSLAEGAGVPAALLYLLLLLAALELARRTLVAATDARERALAAGVAAALVALTTANLLSLGQAFKTFTPLFTWTALGLLGALAAARALPAARPASAARGAGALVAAVPLVVLPCAGYLLHLAGLAAAADGRPRTALERFDLARRVNPLDSVSALGAAQLAFALEDLRDARRRAEELVADAPHDASRRLLLGHALLLGGDARGALAQFERAAALDPRGRTRTEHLGARARFLLRLGDEPRARALLLEALGLGGGYVQRLLASLPEGGQGFPVGDPARPTGWISLDRLLDVLSEDLLRLAASDDAEDRNEARRRLGRLVELRERHGMADQALALLDRYAALVPERYSTTDAVYLRLLARAGRLDEAFALMERHRASRNTWGALLRALLASGDPAAREAAHELALAGPTLAGDVAFLAGAHAPTHEALAVLALERGEDALALRHVEDAAVDLARPPVRTALARRVLEQAVELDAADATLLALVRTWLRHASMDARTARDAAAMRAVAARVLEAWDGGAEALAAAVEADGALGAAGETFAGVLRGEVAEAAPPDAG